MRISRHQLWMGMCEVLAQRSTCYRGNNGSMVIHNNDVLAVGYNGAAAGEEHCLGNQCPIFPETGGCMKSDHAERNAILRACTKSKRTHLEGCLLYSTSCPCADCADRIVKSRVSVVIFRHPYRNERGLVMLRQAESVRSLYRLTASGYLVNERTGVIEDA